MMYYAHDGGWWWLMAVTSTIFWLVLVTGVAALFVWTLRRVDEAGTAVPPAARAILQERFARGEIDVEELRRGLRVIEGR